MKMWAYNAYKNDISLITVAVVVVVIIKVILIILHENCN